MAVLALYNLKGGVGKTATAVNLACLSSACGLPTLLWDLDPQGAASWYLHSETSRTDARRLIRGESAIDRLVSPTPYDNLDLIPASHSYRYLDVLLRQVKPRKAALSRLLEPFQKSRYALVILDCPPSFSYLAENIFHAADRILLPVIPTWLSLRALEQLQEHFQAENIDPHKLRPFYSMVDRRRSLHVQLLEQPPRSAQGLMRTVVPYSSVIEKMGEHRAPVFGFLPPSHPVCLAYANLWAEARRSLAI